MECAKVIFSLCLVFLLQFTAEIKCQYSSDNCDWTIWNSREEEEGVKTLNVDCSEGHVDWSSPVGAVRINLQSYSRAASFQACFVARSHFSTVKISVEEGETGQLRELVRLDNASHAMPREMCFDSSRKPVTLYVEAEVGDWQARVIGHFDLDYDIKRIFPKVKNIKVDDFEECRPCSNEEILQYICTSDFVVRGSMDAVFHNDDMEETELLLRVTKIHVQRHNIFKPSDAPVTSMTEDGVPSVGAENIRRRSGGGGIHRGTVIVPRKCGIQQGEGAFLLMGRTRLKRAFLRCAPRLEDFQRLWKAATRVGRNPCSLD